MLKLAIWHTVLGGILFFGLPDRVVALIESPGPDRVGLLLISMSVFAAWLYMKPEEA